LVITSYFIFNDIHLNLYHFKKIFKGFLNNHYHFNYQNYDVKNYFINNHFINQYLNHIKTYLFIFYLFLKDFITNYIFIFEFIINFYHFNYNFKVISIFMFNLFINQLSHLYHFHILSFNYNQIILIFIITFIIYFWQFIF
jgi:hypothetical protein